jgi:hypothetical protein
MPEIEDEFRCVNVGTATELQRTEAALEDPDPVTHGDITDLNGTRPITRGECPKAMPCPFVGCRHHLASDEVRGTARIAPGFILIDRNCALHFVDANPGGVTLERVGEEFLLTRERVRQIERKALLKLRNAGVFIDFVDGID